jgi:hypothetical protein
MCCFQRFCICIDDDNSTILEYLTLGAFAIAEVILENLTLGAFVIAEVISYNGNKMVLDWNKETIAMSVATR